jgi:hypothetical protein
MTKPKSQDAASLDPDRLDPDQPPDLFADVEEPDLAELLEIEAEANDGRLFRGDGFDAPDEISPDLDEIGRPVGRLGSPGPDDDTPVDMDDEADAVAWSGDADDLTAEEAAIHITNDPHFGTAGDGYL